MTWWSWMVLGAVLLGVELFAIDAQFYLVFLGIAPQRIQIISYGEERPFALGHGESSWRLNRRSHFVIVAR